LIALIKKTSGVEDLNPFTPENLLICHSLSFNYLRFAHQVAIFCHPRETKKYIKVLIRSLLNPFISLRWYRHISSSDLLRSIVDINKQFAEKLHRHHLRLDNSIDQRYQLLTEHYQIFEKLFQPTFISDVLIKNGKTIAKIVSPSGEIFLIKMNFGGNEGKEGELAISIKLDDKLCLAVISFSLLLKENGVNIYIGGLQGAQGKNSKERVSEASKMLNGLSPTRIVLEACLSFAVAINAVAVLAVSDFHQISKNKSNKHFRYDEYWNKVGGLLNSNGNYELPTYIVRKLKEDTPSKRRAKYRKQHAYLDVLNSGVLESVLKYKQQLALMKQVASMK
jgi:uncharacterized protein